MDLLDKKPIGRKQLPTLSPDMRVRFWSYVHKTDLCWNWTGHRLESGYCQFRVGDKRYRVHRLSYFMHTGKQPTGIIMHTCDNRTCCNPAHLIDGSNAENSEDMVRKGRSHSPKGNLHPGSKLTEEDVLFILDSNLSYPELGRKFGVTPSMICNIKRGRNWTHIRRTRDERRYEQDAEGYV